MFELVILAAALVRDHPADFRAGWEKAKARAELRDRYRHGLIDATTLMMEEAKYLTPQEQAAGPTEPSRAAAAGETANTTKPAEAPAGPRL